MKTTITILSLFILSFSFSLYCQTKVSVNDHFYAETNDIILWNDTIYMCSESPLSNIKGYGDIFKNQPLIHIDYLRFIPRNNTSAFYACWIIVDDELYLGDIKFQANLNKSKKIEKERMMRDVIIEKFTGRKFIKAPFSIDEKMKEYINPNGVVKADWFSDNLYLKKFIYNSEFTDIEDYNKDPFPYLKVKKGKVINIQYVHEFIGIGA